MPLRSRALSRHRQFRSCHRMQLFDLHEEGISSPHRATGQFQLVSGKDDLTTYEFNTKTAKHRFCKTLRHSSILRAALRFR
jgi:hypothetical protein